MPHHKGAVCVYLRDTQDLRIYTSQLTDYHLDIRAEHGLRDGRGDNRLLSRYQTPVELVPVRGLSAIEDYDFRFYEAKPDWWVNWMTGEATREIHRRHAAMWDGLTLDVPGELDLSCLETLPPGVTLKAGGNLNLGALRAIPNGVTLSAGFGLYLRSLRAVGSGVALSGGRYIDVGSCDTGGAELRSELIKRA